MLKYICIIKATFGAALAVYFVMRFFKLKFFGIFLFAGFFFLALPLHSALPNKCTLYPIKQPITNSHDFEWVHSPIWSEDSSTLTALVDTIKEKGTFIVLNIKTGNEEVMVFDKSAYPIALNKGGDKLAYFETEKGNILFFEEKINPYAFLNRPYSLFGRIVVKNRITGQEEAIQTDRIVVGARFSNDNTNLLFVTTEPPFDTLYIEDIQKKIFKKFQVNFKKMNKNFTPLALNFHSDRFITGKGKNGQIFLIDLVKNELKNFYVNGRVSAWDLSKDGHNLFIHHYEGEDEQKVFKLEKINTSTNKREPINIPKELKIFDLKIDSNSGDLIGTWVNYKSTFEGTSYKINKINFSSNQINIIKFPTGPYFNSWISPDGNTIVKHIWERGLEISSLKGVCAPDELWIEPNIKVCEHELISGDPLKSSEFGMINDWLWNDLCHKNFNKKSWQIFTPSVVESPLPRKLAKRYLLRFQKPRSQMCLTIVFPSGEIHELK